MWDKRWWKQTDYLLPFSRTVYLRCGRKLLRLRIFIMIGGGKAVFKAVPEPSVWCEKEPKNTTIYNFLFLAQAK